MVAASGCTLAAGLSQAADEEHLTAVYQVFAEEAADMEPQWQPESINTDGWKATRNSLRRLFPQVLLVPCFLHGFLKIRDRSRKDRGLHARVWDVHCAESAEEFHQRMYDQRMSDLRTWSETQDLKPTAREALSKLFADEDEY